MRCRGLLGMGARMQPSVCLSVPCLRALLLLGLLCVAHGARSLLTLQGGEHALWPSGDAHTHCSPRHSSSVWLVAPSYCPPVCLASVATACVSPAAKDVQGHCDLFILCLLYVIFHLHVTAKKEDSCEVLDLAEYTKNQPWWRKLFGRGSGSSAEKYNVATQLVIGGVTGWCTGFIFQKVGKLAATAVGGGFFLLQIANHTGYIKVDWKLVEQDVSKAKEQLKYHSSGSKLSPEVKSRVDEVITFVKKNVILTGGFAGGFLLGMSS
uniref:FUN14 domain-containing protein 2 n=1 Tax=Chrysemys picta bellii TaxID=8478 RepID=A0A8C3FFP6_CHRPI